MKQKSNRIGVRPVDVEKAISLHRAGNLEDARRRYENILSIDRGHVTVLHFLGVLHHQTGNSDVAIATIQRAIELDPAYVDAHNNLGNIFRETNQLDAAFRAYQHVVELAPGHADAWNNLGVMLRSRGQYDEAQAAYSRAIELNPSHVAAWQNRGSLLARLDQLDVAIAAYRRVLELHPRDTLAYDALARAVYRTGRIDEAIAVYHEWMLADPGNAVALHMLAACSGDLAPERASDRYVRDTFDAFASSFDQVLDQLGYRAPGLVAAFLDRVIPDAKGTLTVADAGCGTGLCAEFLRPRAKRLVGVDLSPGMLARARVLKKYDDLIEAELTAWLASQPQEYDLIISADTLCYFGALEQALSAAANALRPQGRLVFTVENAADNVQEYQLNATGRYSHAETYVRRTLTDAGLEAIEIEPVVLRRERGNEVNGLLVSAMQPAVQGASA